MDNYAGIGLVTDAIRPVLKLTAPAPGSGIPVKEQGTPDPEPVSPTEDEEAPEMKQLFPAPATSPCRRSTQQWLWRQWQCWY